MIEFMLILVIAILLLGVENVRWILGYLFLLGVVLAIGGILVFLVGAYPGEVFMVVAAAAGIVGLWYWLSAPLEDLGKDRDQKPRL